MWPSLLQRPLVEFSGRCCDQAVGPTVVTTDDYSGNRLHRVSQSEVDSVSKMKAGEMADRQRPTGCRGLPSGVRLKEY